MSAFRAALLACGAAASAPVLALGLGEIQMQSFLNEPLEAQVELLDTRQLTVDDVRIRLAGGEDFDRMGVDRGFFLTNITFEVVIDEDTGRGSIKLATQEPVLEPFLDLIIEARWPSGRLLREYTVLVDPPAFGRDTVTVSASQSVAAMEPKPAASAPASADRSETKQSSGDTVSVRGSDLAPGEMPSRDFSAATVSDPQAGSRYMVRRDETLWQIASEGKPDGTSVQQAMLEIQRLNPEAFIDGNINRIKAGYIIYLPAAGEISSDDLSLALDEVREQNQAWQARRSSPGVTAAATLRVSAEPMADLLPTTSEPDALASTSGSGVSSSAAADAPSQSAAAAQDAMRDAGMNDELSAKLDAMTDRLDTLEQIVALKDEQIATLEQALREAREAAANQPTAPQVAATPTLTPAPTTAPTSTPPVTSTPAESAGGVPWMPAIGGILALVIGGLFFWRRRAAKEEEAAAASVAEDDVFAGVSLQKDAIAAEPEDEFDTDLDAAVVDEALDEELEQPVIAPAIDDAKEKAKAEAGGSRGYGERKHDDYIDEGASGDALAEADIYIAYGRYLQAIELLDTAIEDEPNKSAYRVKLIELYVDMGEEQSANQQMEKLRVTGDETAIARAEALLGGVVLDDIVTPSIEAVASEEVAADESDDIELALDLDQEDEEQDTGDDLGMDLDADAAEETLSLDLADDVVEDAVDTFESAESEAGEIEFDGLEIEDDSDLPDEDHDVLDFSEAEEELDLSDALVDAEAADSNDATADEGEELLIAEDADQMATKLDLARAYIDMGDADGAKVILEEVAASGSGEQQQEASELLSRIG